MRTKTFIFLLVNACNVLFGQTLDESFGSNGKVVTELSTSVDGVNEILQQPDGKIIALGSANNRIQMARYNSDGSLDNTFGTNGIVNTQLLSGFIFLSGGLKFLLQEDGKIVLIGNGSINNGLVMRLMRYNSNGQLDPTFGNNGQVNLNSLYQFANSDSATNILQTPNGGLQIIISTQANTIYVIQFNSNGILDTTFGTNGISLLTTPQDSSNVYTKDHYIFPSGDSLIASWLTINGQYDFCLFKIKSNGVIDSTFGTNGFVITDLGSNADYSESVAVQPDGKIVVGGTSNFKYALVRYNSDGNLDTSFNSTGINLTTVGSNSFCTDMFLDDDGKIILVGNIVHDFGCIRYNQNGTLDNTFGNNGKYIIDFCNSYDYGRAILKQSDGKFVLGGMTSFMCSNRAFALTRLTQTSLNTEYEILNNTVLHPNPVENLFEIQSKEIIEEVIVCNSLGQLVEKFKNQNQYNIESLSSGIYTIIVTTNQGKLNMKIIKK